MLDKTIKSSNVFGKFGDWLGNFFIFESIGIAAFIIAFLCFVFGMLILKKNYFKTWKTIGHPLFFICWLPIFMGAVTGGESVLGGVYGFQMMDFLKTVIGIIGLWLVILSSITLYFILEFNLNLNSIKSKFNNLNENTLGKAKSIIPNSSENSDVDEELNDENENQKISSEINILNDFNIIKTPNHTSFDQDFSKITVVDHGAASIDLNPNSGNFSSTKIDDIDFKVEVAKTIDILDDTDQKSQELVEKHGLYDHKLDLANFQMPLIDLLKDYGNEEISINKDELEENKNKIVGLLKNFNVGIAEIKATIGPTVTLYEIVPEAGIRVASIKKLQDDIALNLSALGIRIIAPMPGKGTIGIEVPRKNPSMVSMRNREAIDSISEGTFDKEKVETWMKELEKVYNRGFWSGYYLGQELGEWSPNSGSNATQKKIYIGKGRHFYPKSSVAEFLVEAYDLNVGDKILIQGPTTGSQEMIVENMRIDQKENSQKAVKNDIITFKTDFRVRPSDKLYKIVQA
jgi:S-DNA-T family DNA segregation ATPase FtsK/SpoIIIE